MNGIGNMKITLDLKEFEHVITFGIKSVLKDNVNITDVITPFGTFHIGQSSEKRSELFNKIHDDLKVHNTMNAIKTIRATLGCGLKEAKDFVDKLRDDLTYRKNWLNGDDTFIHRNWDANSRGKYEAFIGEL